MNNPPGESVSIQRNRRQPLCLFSVKNPSLPWLSVDLYLVTKCGEASTILTLHDIYKADAAFLVVGIPAAFGGSRFCNWETPIPFCTLNSYRTDGESHQLRESGKTRTERLGGILSQAAGKCMACYVFGPCGVHWGCRERLR